MTAHTLRLEHVGKEVGKEVHLHGIDLAFSTGLTVLIGHTLAGKTSLMRLMAGLDRPTEGRVLMDGRDVTREPVQRRQVAMVYQQFINYPSMTVYENIASPLRIARMDRATVDRRVREVAEMLHIEGLLDRLPNELSGGQQQRTAMARALVKDARLLLFDEPLVNLDYKLREELRAEMRDIFEQRQAIVVYATTEPLEALLLGGEVVVLDEGRVLQSGTTLDVFRHPASTRVGEVFSDPPMNMVGGTVQSGQARLGNGMQVPLEAHLSELAAGEYRFGIRANHLYLSPNGHEDVEVEAVTELAEVSGSETFVHVSCGGTSWVVQENGVCPVGVGSAVRVYMDPRRLFAFAAGGALVAAPVQGA